MTKKKFDRYDSADYLQTEKQIAAYMDAVMDEAGDDPAFIAHALGVVARARRSMTKLAKDTGLSREGLYKALSKDGNPTFETILKVAKALGLRLGFKLDKALSTSGRMPLKNQRARNPRAA